MVGYPAYVEAINLWLGGPAQPEDVGPDHMWEIRPGSTTKFDAFIDPYGSQGRPLIVTPSGFGNTAGESTLGTQQYRGQFRIYEKLQLGGGYQSTRRANQGTTRGSGGVLGVGGGAPEVFRGGGAKGFGSAGTLSANEGGLESYSGSPEIMNTGRAGIGAGAEETREHFDTGYQYQRNAQPVISVQIEYRQDLQNMLDNAWGAGWGNWWFDELSGNWWEDTSWQWRPRRRVAPQMPVIRPHRPPYGG